MFSPIAVVVAEVIQLWLGPMVMVMVVVVVVDVLFRILLPLRKIWIVIIDASLFLVILEDVMFTLVTQLFIFISLAVQYLGTIVIVLRNGGRIEGRVKSSIVVVGGVQPSVLGLSPVGARDELGDRSECIQRLVDSVVALVAEHHLRLI